MQQPEEVLYRSSKKVCLEAAELASKSPEFFKSLVDLGLSDKKPFAHRACWSMLYLAEKHPSRVQPSLRRIVSSLENIEHHTQIGSLLRMFDTLEFDLEEFGELLDYCLHIIRMPQEREYAKVYAMNIILKFGKTYPELIPEMIEQIELAQENFEMSHCKRKAKAVVKELGQRKIQ